MTDACVVLTTFENRDQARPVIDALISERLAACVQMMDIESSYTWQGVVEHEPEVLVLIKTTTAVYPMLEKRLAELHPYDVPEILQIPVASGSRAYLAWMAENTR